MKSNLFEWVGCGFATIMTMAQTNEVFQVISLVLTIIATMVTIAFTIYKWYKAAKADGKIDEKEVMELLDIITDGTEKLNNIVSAEAEDKGENK